MCWSGSIPAARATSWPRPASSTARACGCSSHDARPPPRAARRAGAPARVPARGPAARDGVAARRGAPPRRPVERRAVRAPRGAALAARGLRRRRRLAGDAGRRAAGRQPAGRPHQPHAHRSPGRHRVLRHRDRGEGLLGQGHRLREPAPHAAPGGRPAPAQGPAGGGRRQPAGGRALPAGGLPHRGRAAPPARAARGDGGRHRDGVLLRVMVVAINQPCYLPWRGHFALMKTADVFVFYDDVQFTSNTSRSFFARVQLKTAGGRRWLTVPVQKSGRFGQRIDEVVIAADARWAARHAAAIREAFRGAPFAGAVEPVLARLDGWERLAQLTITTTTLMAELLEIRRRTLRSSTLGVEGSGSARVLAIRPPPGAPRYVSGPGGRAYPKPTPFDAARGA